MNWNLKLALITLVTGFIYNAPMALAQTNAEESASAVAAHTGYPLDNIPLDQQSREDKVFRGVMKMPTRSSMANPFGTIRSFGSIRKHLQTNSACQESGLTQI